MDDVKKIKTMTEIQREAIIDALARNNWNKTRAAMDLDISIRTIRNWVNPAGQFTNKKKRMEIV